MEKISHKGGILLFQQFSKTQIEIQTILMQSNSSDGKTEQPKIRNYHPIHD